MRIPNLYFLSAWEDKKYERKSKRNLYGQNDAELACIKSQSRSYASKVSDMMGVSRQTLVAVENGKRKLTWGGFMSCFLVFHKNPDTDIMLKAFEIDTEELDEYLGATGQ